MLLQVPAGAKSTRRRARSTVQYGKRTRWLALAPMVSSSSARQRAARALAASQAALSITQPLYAHTEHATSLMRTLTRKEPEELGAPAGKGVLQATNRVTATSSATAGTPEHTLPGPSLPPSLEARRIP